MIKWILTGLIGIVAGGYLLWSYLTPVEIVAVHDNNTLLVRHFPTRQNSQIAWWEANVDSLQQKYGIPRKDEDGYFSVSIQDFGHGYQAENNREEDGELLCFDDMDVPARCIIKAPLMRVGWSQNRGLTYKFFGSRH